MLKRFKRKNTTGELVVKPRVQPRVKILIAAAVGAVVLTAFSWIYNHGLSMAGFEREWATRRVQTLQGETERAANENQELREALARAERTIQMDQTAYQDLDRSLKVSAQEIVKLREELNFYRNIISPPDQKSGLRIQNLYIEPAAGVNRFSYKLVLIQALKHERSISGIARFEISGVQGGQDTVLRVPAANERPIGVNFKYFQDIEGRFELPRNFKPLKVKVSVTTSGGTQEVEAVYAWPQA
ncbi:MAG: hypothetical protein A2151_00760 [Candidatus Muproteobacteria bacterium RBG_16_65_34]|uniref:Uncharacterized protein n=1 Tax=Candidatus Muproteobacteria bacterium RBG_16_65_34 TaxID=1817760 RepID=A0A1F6TTG2_9PROT|nr:MAG: hypothetical protein A2151_00760 [Candidatus Muproteobacteria bacterium RBG_16_65_34]